MRVILFSLLLMSLSSAAQFQYKVDTSTPVMDLDGVPLSMPWAGGLNAAEYNTMNLNHDGVDDLVLYDRMAAKVLTFISVDNSYQYAPEYEVFFPREIENWLLLRDYNCDGRKDIFTGDVGGIKVYTNITGEGEMLAWKPFLFSTGNGNNKSIALLSRNQEEVFKFNVQGESDDMPALIDADGDGDLDLFNWRYAGNGAEFHQNQSQENGWGCDSLEFIRVTRTWGNFKECNCNSVALNGEDCPPNGGRTKHVGGKSLLMLDLNGDEELDMLFSESNCSTVFQLPNSGTTNSPVINSFSNFPSPNPAFLVNYPAAYFEDVDFDGAKDLLITPNLFTRQYLNTDLSKTNLFYKNTGTTANPSFQLIQNNFIQDRMIDVGDNAVPAFFDYDDDGDQDMFVSQYIFGSSLQSTILVYQNDGTAAEPNFRLVTDNFLSGLLFFYNFNNMKIRFHDINGDNTEDFIFTATDRNTGATGLYFIPNQSKNSLDLSGQNITPANFFVTSGENISLADIDGDGLSDLLVGKSNGSLEHWKNNGNLNFTLVTNAYLGIGSSFLRLNISSTVADLDGDGKRDLAFGDHLGVLRIISDIENATIEQANENLVYNSLTKEYHNQNLGGRIFLTTAHIFNSVSPAIVVGTSLGGIQILKNTNEFQLYPNLMTRGENTNLQVDGVTTLYIYSATGRLVNEPAILQPNEVLNFKTPPLSAGLYIFKFVSAARTRTEKVIIR